MTYQLGYFFKFVYYYSLIQRNRHNFWSQNQQTFCRQSHETLRMKCEKQKRHILIHAYVTVYPGCTVKVNTILLRNINCAWIGYIQVSDSHRFYLFTHMNASNYIVFSESKPKAKSILKLKKKHAAPVIDKEKTATKCTPTCRFSSVCNIWTIKKIKS